MYQSIKMMRDELGLTQLQVAEKVGVSISAISAAEKRGEISKDLKKKIETAFNVQLNFQPKPEITTNSSDLAIQELIKEINFLRNQLEKKDEQIGKKDNLIDALTEKFLKDEVTNWPPMSPAMGFGVGNQRLLCVA